MTIAAKVSAAEVNDQVVNRFVGAYMEARLINAPGQTYTPGTTDDANFLTFEVTLGTGGYARQLIGYEVGDVATYADGGVGLSRKATVFAHDGTASLIEFTHVALVNSFGQVSAVSVGGGNSPASMADGTYTNILQDSTTSAEGSGLTIDLTVSNGGASNTDYAVTVVNPGYGYVNGDTITITNTTLQALDPGVGAGDLVIDLDTAAAAAANAGQIVSVAQPTNAVALGGGNEAAFYWNLKTFGFYS